MIENKEFREILEKYPDDAVMALCLEYNNQKSLFYDLEINGIKFLAGGDEIKAVIIGVIMEKLRDNHLSVHHVFKDFKHGIIVVLLKSIDDVNGVLHVLNVPHGCYEVNYTDASVTIDIPVMENMLNLDCGVKVEG